MNEILKLILAISLPLLLAVVLVSLRSGFKNWRTILVLNPDKGLIKQGLFWLCIIAPFLYFLVFGSFAWSGHNLILSADGFTQFIKISAMPLGLLSLAVPLAVAVARFHSTEQTAKQIKDTQLQIKSLEHKNNLDLYYTHRSELFKYFKQIPKHNFSDSINEAFLLHPMMHQAFFKGDMSSGTPEVNLIMFDVMNSKICELTELLHDFLTDQNQGNKSREYVDICQKVSIIADMTGQIAVKNLESKVSIKTSKGMVPFFAIGESTTDLLAAFRFLDLFIRNLCDFANIRHRNLPEKDTYYLFNGDEFVTKNADIVADLLPSTVLKLRQ